MKRTEEHVTIVHYTSEIHPEITSIASYAAPILEWADAHPVVWQIVMGTRSAPFGKRSSLYLGCDRGDAPASVLARAARFKEEIDRGDTTFWGWRAHFTLDHYKEKGFRGGFFQQFDGTYDRGCAYLDYTPATREAVIDRFIAWCEAGAHYPTREVRIDKQTVRVVDAGKAAR